MKTGSWFSRSGLAILALALLSGCAPFRTEVEQGASLAGITTYRWEDPAMIDAIPIANVDFSVVSATTDQAVRLVVDEALNDAGFLKVEGGTADMVLSYHVGAHPEPLEADEVPLFRIDYELSITITDEDAKLKWRGSTRQLHDSELDDRGRMLFIDRASDRLMKTFLKDREG